MRATLDSSVAKADVKVAPGLIVGAIGVVFGDIGTSPIYTLRECLKAAGGVNQANVFGVVSLILWSIVIVVTVKYVSFVMRADNDGEGGILALTALASGVAPHRLRHVLLMLGVFGAAMFYGDSMITPAISVISAVEGTVLIDHALQQWIVPIALAILTALFLFQKWGTSAVGKIFGPVMIVWFLTLAVMGVVNIVQHPTVLEAASPSFAIAFIANAPGTAFVVLGSVFLALTGGEALYADMGHFGKSSIRIGWLFLVLPSLIITYFGQSALVLSHPSAVAQPFFQSAAHWALIPLVLLSTFATIIASQAVISGAFSMTKQAVQLGLLPRMSVIHTSHHEEGQVYVPFINLALYIAVVFLVMFFQSSDHLAAAYGIAVASTMMLTTFLMYFITHCRWHWRPFASAAVIFPLAVIDLAFVASNAGKILEGGWFPVLCGVVLFTVMTTWYKGRNYLFDRIRHENLQLGPFIESLCGSKRPPPRSNGYAVFPGGVAGLVPHAFLHNLKHNNVIHEINIFLTGTTDNVPFVAEDQKISVEDLGHGFSEVPNVPRILVLAEKVIPGWHYVAEETSFFLARDMVMATGESNVMALWREKLFAFMSRNAAQAAEFYSLPPNRVVELGSQINM